MVDVGNNQNMSPRDQYGLKIPKSEAMNEHPIKHPLTTMQIIPDDLNDAAYRRLDSEVINQPTSCEGSLSLLQAIMASDIHLDQT